MLSLCLMRLRMVGCTHKVSVVWLMALLEELSAGCIEIVHSFVVSIITHIRLCL